MKKKCSSGFTMLEWLISFCVTLIILTIIFQFSAKIYSQLLCNAKCNRMFTEVYVAFDAMSRDISQAPFEKKQWSVVSSSHITWASADSFASLGYFYKNSKLFFVKNNRKNLLLDGIKTLEFTINIFGKQVRSVVCDLSFVCNNKTYSASRTIVLKNREVL